MNVSLLLNSRFRLQERGTDISTELMAGLVTFLASVSSIVINPMILSAAGMDARAVFWASALSAGIASIWMGLWGNLPIALGPAMGLNSYMVYYLVKTLGLSWQNGLACVCTSGCIFMALGLFGMQQRLVEAIPDTVKNAIGPGVGFFLAFIGFQSAGLVQDSPDTLVTLGNLLAPGTLLSLLGILIIAVLTIKQVRGAILIGIAAVTLVGIFVTDPSTGTKFTVLPDMLIKLDNPVKALAPTFAKLSFSGMFSGMSLIIGSVFGILSFLFVDLFDSLGVMLGVLPRLELKKYTDGRFNEVGRSLFVSAGGAAIGAVLGTSTVTIFGAESTTGISEGGRTGLTACVSGVLFLLTTLFSPLVLMVPAAATAPALIVVGIFMMKPLGDFDFSDFTTAMPVFFSILIMPLTYNIAYGLMFSVLSYVVAETASKHTESITPALWCLFVLFLVYFFINATI